MLSILIPAYNADRFVRTAVLSATRQTTKMPVEIIVCDDASTDNTPEVLQNLRSEVSALRVVHHTTNKGVSAARNTLINHLNPATKFVAFFDADDVYLDGALNTALTQFELRPKTSFTYARSRVVPSSILDSGEHISDDWPTFHTVNVSASVIQSDFLAKIGSFNEELSFGEDFDFLLRMAEASQQRAIHNDIIFYYRRHDANATRNIAKMRSGAMRAMMLHARRKAAAPNLCDVSSFMPKSDPASILRAVGISYEI